MPGTVCQCAAQSRAVDACGGPPHLESLCHPVRDPAARFAPAAFRHSANFLFRLFPPEDKSDNACAERIIIVLRVAALVCSTAITASAATSNVQVPGVNRIPSVSHSDFVSSRNLRDVDGVEDSDLDEERAMRAPFIEKLTNVAKSGLDKTQEKLMLALGTNADDAFTKLRVVNSENLFNTQAFTKWSEHVTKISKSNDEAMTAMAWTLATNLGDDKLLKLIRAAKVTEKAKLADDLEAGLVRAWAENKQTANQIFSRLKLNTAEGRLFGEPNLKTWASYVTKINNDNSEAAMKVMFQTLSNNYKDEVALAKLISFASVSASAGELARGLQSAQFKAWIDAGKNSDDIFKAMKLSDTGDKLFSSSRFTIWENFVGALHKQQQGKFKASTLATHYGDEAFVKIIIAAKSTHETLATKLEEGVVRYWKSAEKTSDDVFQSIGLKSKGGYLLVSPETKLWATFVMTINRNDRRAAFADMFSVMSKHYEPEMLARYIQSATPSKSFGNFTSGLQSVQFAEWAKAKKTVKSVKAILKINPDKALDRKRDAQLVNAYTDHLNSLKAAA